MDIAQPGGNNNNNNIDNIERVEKSLSFKVDGV